MRQKQHGGAKRLDRTSIAFNRISVRMPNL